MDGASTLPIRTDWFVAEPVGEGITRYTEPGVHPFLRANCWHVRGRDRDLLVDTGLGVGDLRAELAGRSEREPVVWVTHGHLDHLGGASAFRERWAHPAESDALAQPEQDPLVSAELPDAFRDALVADEPGGTPPPYLVDSVPHAGYRPEDYRVEPAPATRLLADGALVDLGDPVLEVVHLPGHTPGSAGLLERATGTLFSGDVVYDGTLLDELPESSIPHYVASMRRLLTLPVRVVHAGHEPSFDGDRLKELCEAYLARRA